MRNAIRTALAVAALGLGCAVLLGLATLDYFLDPRPYPLGPRRK